MIQTKRQIINRAFAKIGKNPLVVDIDDEEYLDALLLAEAMMEDWCDLNIIVGWVFVEIPVLFDLEIVLDIDDRAYSAIWTNLALRLAEEYGKILTSYAKKQAHDRYSRLLAHYNRPRSRARRTMPAGAGNRRYSQYNNNFLPQRRCDVDQGNAIRCDEYDLNRKGPYRRTVKGGQQFRRDW